LALAALSLARVRPAGAAGSAAPFSIDVHHHYLPPDYVANTPGQQLGAMAPLAGWTPERSIESLDQAGIDAAMLSIVTNGSNGLWFGDDAAARRFARSCNDYGASVVARFPRRFGLLACLPLPDVDGSLAEIEHAFDRLNADGIGVFTSYGNRWLGDPAFAPVMAELDRRKAVLYTHPTVPSCCVNLQPGIPPSVVEFQTDTTRMLASLLQAGIPYRYPNIRIILSHAGGTMPFLIERFDLWSKNPAVSRELPEGVRAALARFHYDTAQSANPVALAALKAVVPGTRVLFGSDFPFRSMSETATALAAAGVLSPAELASIAGENALRLFPRLRR
jgi:predicted TIM-barrel fold metal-dependent hydrolase